jgi:GTP-binding protein Era
MKSGFCVLWGRPNAGKSTLLNALLERKHVIVSPRPQTTRHRIAGVLNGVAEPPRAEVDIEALINQKAPSALSLDEAEEDDEEIEDIDLSDLDLEDDEDDDLEDEDDDESEGDGEPYQIVFLDTPGIHEPLHKLGEALVKTAKSALQDIECVVFVADASSHPHDDDKRAAAMLEKLQIPIILALNKRDAVKDPGQWKKNFESFEKLLPFAATVGISALKGEGLGELKREIVQRLPEGDPYFPPEMGGDRPVEFHIEELIREQALLQLREEIPHSIAVGIEQMEPRPNGTLFLAAFLYIERESQKKIVIGHGGARIREIGQKARVEIETLLGRKVFLELRVKLREKWRDDDKWVRRFGYSSE